MGWWRWVISVVVVSLLRRGWVVGGEGGAQRQAWMQCGRQIVQGVVVDARKGVIFNAWRPHGPERWEGERYAIVAYTSISWHRLPAPMRTELLDLGFPW